MEFLNEISDTTCQGPNNTATYSGDKIQVESRVNDIITTLLVLSVLNEWILIILSLDTFQKDLSINS